MYYVAPFQNVIFHWEFLLQIEKSKGTAEEFTSGKGVNMYFGLASTTFSLIIKALKFH